MTRKASFKKKVQENNRAKYWNTHKGFKCEGPYCTFTSINPKHFEADHKIRLKDGGVDDPDVNGQYLCISCHDRKTACENTKYATSRRLNMIESLGIFEYERKAKARVFGIGPFRVEVERNALYLKGFSDEFYIRHGLSNHKRGSRAKYLDVGNDGAFQEMCEIFLQEKERIKGVR